MVFVTRPVCGKEFIQAPENIYKITVHGRVKHLCSWSCLRAHEREKEAGKRVKEAKRNENR